MTAAPKNNEVDVEPIEICRALSAKCLKFPDGKSISEQMSDALKDAGLRVVRVDKTAAPEFTREELYKAVEEEYQRRKFVMNDTDKANAWLVIKALIDMGVVVKS